MLRRRKFKVQPRSLQTADAVDLVRSARSGSAAAFQLLAHRERPRAVRFATAILRDRDLAEDAVQEALLDCHRKLRHLHEAAAFPAWFRRIVFKHCDRIRRRRDFETVPFSPEQLDVAAPQRSRERNRDIRRRYERALGSKDLSAEERRIARLRFEEERPYREIARRLNISEDTVKNRVRVLRRKLQYLMTHKQPQMLLAVPQRPANAPAPVFTPMCAAA